MVVSAPVLRRFRLSRRRWHYLKSALLLALLFTAGQLLLRYLATGRITPNDLLLVLPVGTLIGLLVGVLEVYVFPRLLVNRSLGIRVLVSLLLHSLVFALMVRLIQVVFEWEQQQLLVQAALAQTPLGGVSMEIRQLKTAVQSLQLLSPRQSAYWWLYAIYAVPATMVGILYQVSQKIGPRTLIRLLTGYYLKPVEERRLFMFADVKNSTALAELLGHVRYSALIRDFYFDLGEPIAESYGEVYQYVGDEVVITWPWKAGLRDACCLQCYFWMQRAIEARREYYLRVYGTVPAFKAGLHGGRVITTQVGDIRSELVFHGDVLNTTARIQAQCNALGSWFLISQEVREQFGEQPEFAFTPVGGHVLRGKTETVDLVDVRFHLAASKA